MAPLCAGSPISPVKPTLDPDVSTRVADPKTIRFANRSFVPQVETFDINQSTLRVRATKYGLTSGELANEVQRRIVRDLQL